jgi:hypothetical protein
VLNWIVEGSLNKERFDFIRRLLDVVPEEELAGIDNLVSKAKKHRKRPNSNANKSAISKKPTVSVPEKSVSAPVCFPEEVGWYEKFGNKIVAIDVEKVNKKH